MTPAGMHRRWSSLWPRARAALVFAVVFGLVLASWLPDTAHRSLAGRFDILLLLVFLGVVIAFTVEADPSLSEGERPARRGWRLRIGGLPIRRRK
jgi:hypothetical protein